MTSVVIPTVAGPTVDDLVVPLARLRRTDLPLAGGKGANLGEMVGAGFDVPDGFVVTTRAYLAVAALLGSARAGRAATASETDSASARASFEHVELPPALATAIVDAYAGMGGGPVAVRSSATAEDLPGAAFAGQQDTYLDVVGEAAVLDAVRRCWGSLWSDRAVAYRRRLDLRPDDVAMAVVVQRMVRAEFAGVLFTADPLTGRRDQVVVDAAAGLGEAVVSGRVVPDHYVVDADGSVRLLPAGQREGRQTPGTFAAGGVSPTNVRAGRLPQAAVATLARTGRAVERHFGRPQDVEWAYADGRFWLVQARPMTALPPPPLALSPVQRRIGQQLLDYATERPYPLDVSAWIVPGIGRMVQRMLAEILGLRMDPAAMFPEVDDVVERFVPPVPRPTLATIAAAARLPGRIRRFHPAAWTDDPRFTRFRAGMRDLERQDPATLDWPRLLELPRRALAVTDLITDLRVDYLPRVGFDLVRLRALLALLRRGRSTAVLMVPEGTKTAEANLALEQLAALARADPALRAAFTELDPAALFDRLEHDPAFAGYAAHMRRFLAEYGHRETASPLLVSAPTWRDDPATVLRLVRVLLDQPRSTPSASRATDAEDRLLGHRLVRLTGMSAAVRRRLDSARAGVAFREDSHFYATQALPVLRRALLEIGGRLAAAGALDDRDHVWHVRWTELESLPDPERLPAADRDRLRGIARERAARRAELAGAPLIAASDLRSRAPRDAGVLVSGVPASGGVSTGPVRVIQDVDRFSALRPGDVLVCRYTNPAWTPLFQRAAAVVVDSGGSGSHAAIIAREYGVPAVMGTGDATRVLTDGQLVTVDGNAGLVTAADRPDPEREPSHEPAAARAREQVDLQK